VAISWTDAVIEAMHRFSERHQTRLVERSFLIEEELAEIVRSTGSRGVTPSQTLSRVLQELRRAGVLHHAGLGVDILLDQPVRVEEEDLPLVVINTAIQHDLLRISEVETHDESVVARRRIGQARLRYYTLLNYRSRCGLCDVDEPTLLVASHIVRWSDNQDAQGRLSNIICLCRMHDPLFENGYIAFDDDLAVVRPRRLRSTTVAYLASTARQLSLPESHPPALAYIQTHRRRVGG
jgi:hypothetical protein